MSSQPHEQGPAWTDKLLREAEHEPEQMLESPRFAILVEPDLPVKLQRPTVPPYCGVGQLVYKKPGGKRSKGTAFAIGGNFIMTAAHCVCKYDTSNLNSEFVFVPASHLENGVAEAMFGAWQIKPGTLPKTMPGWHDASIHLHGHIACDVAVIELESRHGKTLEETVGAFRLRFDKDWTVNDVADFALDALGYPKATGDHPLESGEMYIQRGSFVTENNGVMLRHGRMGRGSSGGPWVHSTSMSGGKWPKVYGLTSHSRHQGENSSPAFDKTVEAFVRAAMS